MFRQMGCGLSSFASLGKCRVLGGGIRNRSRLPGGGGTSPIRQHHCSSPCACCGRASKKGGQEAQGLGRSRGGFTSKLHIAATDESTPVAIVLTPGERHDAAVFDELLDAVPPECRPEKAIADKGYDSAEIREAILARS